MIVRTYAEHRRLYAGPPCAVACWSCLMYCTCFECGPRGYVCRFTCQDSRLLSGWNGPLTTHPGLLCSMTGPYPGLRLTPPGLRLLDGLTEWPRDTVFVADTRTLQQCRCPCPRRYNGRAHQTTLDGAAGRVEHLGCHQLLVVAAQDERSENLRDAS